MKQKIQASDVLVDRGDEFDLGSIIDTLVNHRVMIAVTATVILALGALYAFCSTPVYQANLAIKVEDNTSTNIPDARDLVRKVLEMSSAQEIKGYLFGMMKKLGVIELMEIYH